VAMGLGVRQPSLFVERGRRFEALLDFRDVRHFTGILARACMEAKEG